MIGSGEFSYHIRHGGKKLPTRQRKNILRGYKRQCYSNLPHIRIRRQIAQSDIAVVSDVADRDLVESHAALPSVVIKPKDIDRRKSTQSFQSSPESLKGSGLSC